VLLLLMMFLLAVVTHSVQQCSIRIKILDSFAFTTTKHNKTLGERLFDDVRRCGNAFVPLEDHE